jgi:hypothetical protein
VTRVYASSLGFQTTTLNCEEIPQPDNTAQEKQNWAAERRDKLMSNMCEGNTQTPSILNGAFSYIFVLCNEDDVESSTISG